jgi:Protein of unknown function (DUF1565)
VQNTIYATRALLVAVITASPLVIAAGPASAASVYYVAPNGNDSAAGTQAAPWATIARAQTAAKAGDTVYLRGGRYSYTRANSACSSQTARVDAITLNKSGSSGNPIRYWAHPGERPIFDFSRMKDDCRIKGFSVTGNWIHLKGLEVTGVPQNNNRNAESWGLWISGSNNVFEQIDTHQRRRRQPRPQLGRTRQLRSAQQRQARRERRRVRFALHSRWAARQRVPRVPCVVERR